ncbi:hypothetical protein V2J09_023818 [Rumex salicifolius]
MSLALTDLSRWLWSSKKKEKKLQNVSNLLISATELNLLEVDSVKFPLTVGRTTTSKSRRVNRKLHARQKQKIDREYDVVLVPSDGSCISDSDSDASDWSIGWSEPHAPGFQSNGENDGGFGVLVQCYGSKNRDATRVVNKSMVNASEPYSSDSKKYMEQWLSSLQSN